MPNMIGPLERAFAVLELLVDEPAGLPLSDISDALAIPRSATHRLLTSLSELGYLRQDQAMGNYVLTLKVVSLALKRLSTIGIVELAQPTLDRLAELSGELVRLSIVDDETLMWVAKAQGAKAGLRYDPDTGTKVKLSCSASGLAWLATFSDDHALELVYREGFAKPSDYGPTAPATVAEFLERLHRARDMGYATVNESFEVGTAAMAAPIMHPTQQQAIGVLSIAGPNIRMTEQRMQELVPALITAAIELSHLSLETVHGPRTLAKAQKPA
jgi:DNA-binding IclR family transcriptional regulator